MAENMDETEGSGLVVALVGATGSVGQDLLSTLSRSRLPVSEWRLMASRASRTGSLEVDGRSLRVHPLPEAPAESSLFENVDLVIFATPPEVTREHAPALAGRGTAVIDVGAALADQAPLVVPALGLESLAGVAEGRIACSPTAAVVLLATVLAPLFKVGAERARGTVLLSAGVAGRDAMEELSGQVVSLFNQAEPPRRIFPNGLAFDLHPQVGTLEEPWTSVERRLSTEVATLLRIRPAQVAFTVAMVPLFSGVAAAIQVSVPGGLEPDVARHALSESSTIRLSDPLPGPRRLAGKAAAYVGRLRADPLGDGLHLWAEADNLRFGASTNVIAIATALWKAGLL